MTPLRSCRGWTALESRGVRATWRRIQLKPFLRGNWQRKPWNWVTSLALRGKQTATAWTAHIAPGTPCNAPLQDAATEAVSAGWTSAHLRVRISTCQGVPGMPLSKLQKRVKERSSQPSQPPHEMRRGLWRGLLTQGRGNQMQPPLKVTRPVTARRK